MHRAHAATRGAIRAASTSISSRGIASTSGQAIASTQRRALRSTAFASKQLPPSFFSTSSRTSEQASKETVEKKKAENEAGAEVLGSESNKPDAEKSTKTEKDAGSGTAELEKTIKEKDARIKELSVSGLVSYEK